MSNDSKFARFYVHAGDLRTRRVVVKLVEAGYVFDETTLSYRVDGEIVLRAARTGRLFYSCFPARMHREDGIPRLNSKEILDL